MSDHPPTIVQLKSGVFKWRVLDDNDKVVCAGTGSHKTHEDAVASYFDARYFMLRHSPYIDPTDMAIGQAGFTGADGKDGEDAMPPSLLRIVLSNLCTAGASVGVVILVLHILGTV